MSEGFIRSTVRQSYRNQLWLLAGGVAVIAVITIALVSSPDLKNNRALILIVGCLIALVLLWKIPDTLAHMRHMPANHPITIELSRFGEPEVIADEVDRELQEGRERIGNIGITENWFVYPKLGALSLMRLDEIVWVYKKIIRYHTNGAFSGKNAALIIWDKQGIGLTITDYEDITNGMLQALTERVPWAIFGYTAERDAIWKSVRSQMIEAVDKSREALAQTPPQPADNPAKM